MGYKYSKYNVLTEYDDNHKLLYNIISDALLKLDKSGVEAYQQCLQKDGGVDDAKRKILVDHGFLIPEEMDELAFLSFSNKIICYEGDGMTITIAPTMACNMRCVYCFEEHKPGMMSEEIQEKVCEYIFAQVRRYHIKRLRIEWFGGEPLLCLGIIQKMSWMLMGFCQEEKIQYSASMITNGTLLTPDAVEKLEELQITSVQITVDGCREVHDVRRIFTDGSGSYDVIMKNLELFREKPIQVNLRVNIDKQAIDAYDRISDVVSRLGMENVTVYPAHTESFPGMVYEDKILEREDFALLAYASYLDKSADYDLPQKYFACQAQSVRGFAVDHHGDLYKCWNKIGMSHCAYGNVSDGEVRNIQNYIEYMGDDVLHDPVCRDCIVLPLCYGGCPYLRKANPEKRPCIPEKYCLDKIILKKYNTFRKK